MNYKLTEIPNTVLRSDGYYISSNSSDWEIYEEWLAEGNSPEPTDVVHKTPDWDGLAAKVLGKELLPLFHHLTSEAINSNAISLARNDISLAISVIKNEDALAAGLALLQQCGFVFTKEEKQLWNKVIKELYFSDLVKI